MLELLVQVTDKLFGETGPNNLAAGVSWEKPVSMVIPTPGDDQQVLFILERLGQPSPYRSLRLWLNLSSSDSP